MHRVLVTGGGGQLAQAIRWVAKGHDVEVYAPTHAECDITSHESLRHAMQGVDVVINAAAYTNVDGAERNMEEAHLVNVVGARNVVNVAQEMGLKAIHISTDYVFGGDDNRDKPYGEREATNPINVYGATKAEGEREVLRHNGIVVRTSWLYSPWGKNFCRTILRNAKAHSMLRVVDDQRGTPTSAISLARALIGIVERGAYKAMEGIYHYTNRGEATWYDFAREIIARAEIEGCDIVPCSSDEWPAEAQRPHYSCLDTERMIAMGIAMEGWREALEEVITIIGQDDDI
jgi:dTDP-4-dehydrorhamnose reductase